jgi:DNA-binding response OmpR family regulator
MRILVVEDEKELANAISRGLQKQGYATDIAYDGEEALYKAEVNDYDLIILDLNLPKIDGVEVCSNLRASGSPTGILMLTARSSLDDRTRGLEQGADDYLVKPFHFPELLARVRAILRRKGEPRNIILKTGDFVIDPNTLKGYFKES